MKKIIFICCFIFICFFLVVRSNAQINPFSITSKENELNYNEKEFAPFDSLIKDKKYIFIGESSHMVNEFHQFKLKMIKYLHEKHGFDLIFYESGFYECAITDYYKERLCTDEILYNSLHANFLNTYSNELIKYNKANKLNFWGFDVQPRTTTRCFPDTIYKLLDASCSKLGTTLKDYDCYYNKILNKWYLECYINKHRNYYFNPKKHKKYVSKNNNYFVDSLNLLSNKIVTLLNNQLSNKVEQAFLKKLLLFTIDYRYKYLAFKHSKQYSSLNSHNYREKNNATTINYLLTELLPNKKVIFLAHNTHIAKEGLLFQSLSDSIKKDSYVIAQFMSSGNYRPNTWDDTKILSFNPKKNSIEKAFENKNDMVYNMLFLAADKYYSSWITKKYRFYKLVKKFNLMNNFDSFVLFNTGHPATLYEREK